MLAIQSLAASCIRKEARVHPKMIDGKESIPSRNN